ncbi:hypothetical protein AQUCO_00700287v1 [Aquilegia coerulea]|uniref:Uncharacterized protein n=1 Tax=Aquilegia coerulea TaxID=218851 RepID=A0A2G5EJT4_AQUCA|nr:hypothetical protein AQUCO_00700287v1 [Aquilegia coerulea]
MQFGNLQGCKDKNLMTQFKNWYFGPITDIEKLIDIFFGMIQYSVWISSNLENSFGFIFSSCIWLII